MTAESFAKSNLKRALDEWGGCRLQPQPCFRADQEQRSKAVQCERRASFHTHSWRQIWDFKTNSHPAESELPSISKH